MGNCRKIVIVQSSQTCCFWQVFERSGSKPKAIKSSMRRHAKHGGKLQQWRQWSRRPPFPFIRHPPLQTLGSCFKTDAVQNTPPPFFTQPSEENQLKRSRRFKAFTPWAGGTLGQINSPEITVMGFHKLVAPFFWKLKCTHWQGSATICFYALHLLNTLHGHLFLNYKTTFVCKKSFWQASHTSLSITQDNHVILVDLWKVNYCTNIDSHALCDINLGCSPLICSMLNRNRDSKDCRNTVNQNTSNVLW